MKERAEWSGGAAPGPGAWLRQRSVDIVMVSAWQSGLRCPARDKQKTHFGCFQQRKDRREVFNED